MRCEQLLDALNNANKQDAVASNTDLGKAGKWTILVYLDADNNLEGAGVGDVQEMITKATSGGYGNNKVYVLMDRINGYDITNMPNGFGNFEGSRLFEVVTGTGTLTPRSPGAFFANGGNDGATGTSEINMGDRAILEGFLKWGLAQASTNGSDYVYLDIWDHGAGWGGQAYGGNAVAWDDTNSHDALSIDEIRTAITNAHAAGTSNGKTVTILGFDACYMGTVENAFSFKDLVKIVIGSEEVEPGNGWDYSAWLPGSDTSPTDLASKVVTTYGAYYAAQGGQNVTLAAYDLSKSPSVQSAVDSFVGAIGSATSSQVTTARTQAQNYNNNLAVDLYHFAQLINIPESNGLKTSISNMVIKETHTTGGSVKNSYGMTVYFPTSTGDYDTTYNNTVFATLTKWDDFISGKINTYQASANEPGDATCGTESNNTSSTATSFVSRFTGSGPYTLNCTGYIYTNTDIDYYRFGLTTGPGSGTIRVQLTNIPAGANYDVYLYIPYFSPSSHVAVGYNSSNGNEDFTYNVPDGVTTITLPALGTCQPPTAGQPQGNSVYQQGYCYGNGTGSSTANHNVYVIVKGRSGSYNQLSKYTLTVTATGTLQPLQPGE